MGSTKRSKSTRGRNDLRGVQTISGGRADSARPSKFETALADTLDHLSKALSILETTARAFEAAQNDGQCSSTGAEVATLRYGVIELRAIHEEFDLAIAKVSP